MRYWLAVLIIAACSSPTAAPICDAEKRAVWAEAFGGEPTGPWLAGNVWRLDPVHTVYFAATPTGCVVTRQGP